MCVRGGEGKISCTSRFPMELTMTAIACLHHVLLSVHFYRTTFFIKKGSLIIGKYCNIILEVTP